MKKKGNLVAALSDFDRRPSNTTSSQPKQDNALPAKAPITAERTGYSTQPPSRRGKKALTGYFEPEVIKQLKLLAVSEDKTVQALMGEGINEVFKKYGRPHIA